MMLLMRATGDVHASRRSRRVPPPGFTLLELMIVLAIMALMTVALPTALNRMLPARRVALAAERLIEDIRSLQLRSSAVAAPARLTLLPSGYRLEVRGHVENVALPRTMTLRLRRRETDTELQVLILYPDGTTSAGRFEISDSGRRAVIEMELLTGRARRTA